MGYPSLQDILRDNPRPWPRSLDAPVPPPDAADQAAGSIIAGAFQAWGDLLGPVRMDLRFDKAEDGGWWHASVTVKSDGTITAASSVPDPQLPPDPENSGHQWAGRERRFVVRAELRRDAQRILDDALASLPANPGWRNLTFSVHLDHVGHLGPVYIQHGCAQHTQGAWRPCAAGIARAIAFSRLGCEDPAPKMDWRLSAPTLQRDAHRCRIHVKSPLGHAITGNIGDQRRIVDDIKRTLWAEVFSWTVETGLLPGMTVDIEPYLSQPITAAVPLDDLRAEMEASSAISHRLIAAALARHDFDAAEVARRKRERNLAYEYVTRPRRRTRRA